MNDVTSLVRRVERAERRARWSMAVAGLAACTIALGAVQPANQSGVVLVGGKGTRRIKMYDSTQTETVGAQP